MIKCLLTFAATNFHNNRPRKAVIAKVKIVLNAALLDTPELYGTIKQTNNLSQS